jgi:hypothetical protein
MSVVATALVLGLLVIAMLKARWVRFSGALACVLFGVVLGLTPIGPALDRTLTDVGDWTIAQLRSV